MGVLFSPRIGSITASAAGLVLALVCASSCARSPAGPAATALTEPRSARVARARSPVTLDGRLDEPAWRDGTELAPLVAPQSGELDVRPFSARLLWDDDALYVGVRADDADLYAARPATIREQDQPQCGADCVDLLLDPAGNGRDYREIQLSPTNTLYDARWAAPREPGPHGDAIWTSNATAAVQSLGTVNAPGDTDHGWSAELRVPWGALGRASAPDAGTTVRANLYVRDQSATNSVRVVAWSATRDADLHLPNRFGRLTFAR